MERMKKIKSVETALSSFKIAATNQVTATETGDYKKGNKAFEQIIQIIKYLKDCGSLRELETLLFDSNVGIKMFAAYGLLQEFPKIAVPILEEIAKRDDIHSLTASTTLEQWAQKNLKFPY